MIDDMIDEQSDEDQIEAADVRSNHGRHGAAQVQENPNYRQESFKNAGSPPKKYKPVNEAHIAKVKLADMSKEGNYSPHAVVEKMLNRKERKIPGSVFKPHSDEIYLL